MSISTILRRWETIRTHIFHILNNVSSDWEKTKPLHINIVQSVKGAFRLGTSVLPSGLKSCVVVFSVKAVLLLTPTARTHSYRHFEKEQNGTQRGNVATDYWWSVRFDTSLSWVEAFATNGLVFPPFPRLISPKPHLRRKLSVKPMLTLFIAWSINLKLSGLLRGHKNTENRSLRVQCAAVNLNVF